MLGNSHINAWINENIKDKDNELINEKVKKISKTKTKSNIGSESSDFVTQLTIPDKLRN